MESKKMIQRNLFLKQKSSHIHGKQTYGYQKEKRGWGAKLKIWDKQVHTTIYKIDEQQGLLYSTGNYIQYFVIISDGEDSEKEYTYITGSLCGIPATL